MILPLKRLTALKIRCSNSFIQTVHFKHLCVKQSQGTFLTVWVVRDKYIAKYIEEKLSGETNNYIVYGDIQRQALFKETELVILLRMMDQGSET